MENTKNRRNALLQSFVCKNKAIHNYSLKKYLQYTTYLLRSYNLQLIGILVYLWSNRTPSKFYKQLMISSTISSNIFVPSSNTWFLFQYAYILNASSKVAMLTHGQALKSIKNEQPFSFSSQFRKFCNRDMYPFHDTENKNNSHFRP